MAERLTEFVTKNCSKPFYRFNENCHISIRYRYCNNIDKAINKLGRLEDIMEKYDIEDLEQLDIMLFCLSSETKFQLKQLQKLYKKYNIKSVEELEKKLADSDTWQKACELACEREDDCYVYDNIHRAYEFYQQAKKEKNENKN